MKKYVAWLRGINISGKNKIAMTDLKAMFWAMGLEDAVTYLNSGNVVFSSAEEEAKLCTQIQEKIRTQFALEIPVLVMCVDDLEKILEKAPDWWGTESKEIYDNLIFVLPPATGADVAEKMGAPTEDLERIAVEPKAIFWSFDRQKYAKAHWWKQTAQPGIGEMLTIRTANTVRKVAALARK